MENLLAVDEGEGSSKENKDEHRKENVDEEDGVVPLEMQRDVQSMYRHQLLRSYYS